MKKLLFITLLAFGMSAKAQTNHYADSVKKYNEIAVFYIDHMASILAIHPSLDVYSLISKFAEKENFYQHKLDILNNASAYYRDSIATIADRKYLETKYHIKLK